jgi:hypothetical protein
VATIPKLSTKALTVFLQRYYEEEEERKTDKGGNFVEWVGRDQELGF